MKKIEKSSAAGVTIQLHLLGIVVFSLSLVLASTLMTYGFVKGHEARSGDKLPRLYTAAAPDGSLETEMTNVPPWGQLVARDLDLEQPQEYVAYKTDTNNVETWTFPDMNPAAVRAAMQSCGLTPDQIGRALSPASMIYANSNTVIIPDRDLVFSLPPGERAKLYGILGQFSANELIQFPFCFSGNSFDARFDKFKVSAATRTLLAKALYPRGDAQCFSDLWALMRCIPDEEERLQTVKALSHQTAVLLGVRVWPNTDIDKVISYWSAPGVRLMDIHPLLNSLKHNPNGGSVSILYFLPPFARQRLYTYPLPAQPGDTLMNCHWSTMNFFNEKPDNGFSDPAYTVQFLLAHFYSIAKPGRYGDRIFILNQQGNAVHSAVYLADDIVFTKNGGNAAQPWILVHLKDLLAAYATDGPPRMIVYRNKDW
jgi:hypothetical protein